MALGGLPQEVSIPDRGSLPLSRCVATQHVASTMTAGGGEHSRYHGRGGAERRHKGRRRRTNTVRTCVAPAVGAPSLTKTVKTGVYIENGIVKKPRGTTSCRRNSTSRV